MESNLNHDINILVVDDETNIRRSIQMVLEVEGYKVYTAPDSIKAMELIYNHQFALIILDIRLEDGVDGIGLFRRIKNRFSDIPVIFISGNASLEEAAKSVKEGAYDFLEKPLSSDKISHTVKRCLEYFKMKEAYQELLSRKNSTGKSDFFVGESKKINDLKNTLIKVAKTSASVLILGETGTGKELMAKLIHENSPRNNRQMIKVNCSAIPENLIESELFGHTKGSFTGAHQDKSGLFEAADGGTIFLDEIGDLPYPAQAKLLRVLQSSEIQKVGSTLTKKVDVRVISATHKDLQQMVQEGKFREDLYYRLNVIPVESVPLREHLEDLPLIINYFLKMSCNEYGVREKELSIEAYNILKEYPFPGNVRELKNIIERMVILSTSDVIETTDLPQDILKEKTEVSNQSSNQNCNSTLKNFKESAEREFILSTLKSNQGNISKAAKILDIERTFLHKKIQQYNIEKREYF